MATVSNVTTTTTTTIPPANAPGNKGKNKNKGKKRNFKDLATEESNDSITMTDVNDAAAPNSKKAKIENSMDIVPIEGVDDVKVETNGHNNNNNNNNDTNDPAAWSNLQVSEPTQRAIKDLGFEKMTEIQYKAIPEVMAGHDLAGGAKTGSGKTLAFVIPAVEMLVKNNWTLQKGTGVIIVAPTRELALQIKGVAQQIVKYHKGIRVGLVIGGGSKMAETHALRTGCPVLVATPGRLFDHLSTTRFTFSNLKVLVIDEADHILDIGFEQQMNDILDLLPTERQTLLFSATLNNKIKDLVSKAFRNRPVFVKAQGEQKGPTADKLVQMYSIIPQDKKLVSLLSWLKHHQNEKILVFFSTRKGTKFYEDLFHALGINVLALYGAMSQDVRTRTFFKFVEAKSGILLATNVASRGLDFPAVHWIIQYDPPEEPKEYIHRVGRTARAGLKGEALTFLRESELSYLDILRACDLELQEIKINIDDADEIQKKVEETVSSRYVLQKDAVEAFKSFIRGYQQRAVTIFGNDGVNSDEAAKSFGLSETPKYQSRGFRGRGRSKDGGNFRGGSGQSRGFGRGGFGRGGRGESRGGRGGFGRGRGRGEFGRGRGRGESRGRGNGSRGGFME